MTSSSQMMDAADRRRLDQVRGFRMGAVKPLFRLEIPHGKRWAPVVQGYALKDLTRYRADLPPAVRARSRVVKALPGCLTSRQIEPGGDECTVRIFEVLIIQNAVPW